jgi:hypothetical protein
MGEIIVDVKNKYYSSKLGYKGYYDLARRDGKNAPQELGFRFNRIRLPLINGYITDHNKEVSMSLIILSPKIWGK